MKSFNLPPTKEHPDNTYFDTRAVSWEFVVDGHKATRGFIQPDFDEVFPVAEGGEQISLVNHQSGARLCIDVLGEEGRIDTTHILQNDGDEALVPGGKDMRIKAIGGVVEYVCAYLADSIEE